MARNNGRFTMKNEHEKEQQVPLNELKNYEKTAVDV